MSKAQTVRELFDAGKIDMTPASKKAIAAELGMTVQTVHATLVKHIGKPAKHVAKNPSPISSTKPRKKQEYQRKRAIVLNEENKDKHKGTPIKVTWAPNVWGLPIVNPPIEVIDDNYNAATDDVLVGVDENGNIELINA